MHQGSFFVAAAGSLHRLRSRTAGCILGPPTDHFQFLGRRPTRYERFLFAFAGRRLHRLVVPSHGVREDLVENFFASPRRLQVVHNGIDLEAVRRKARDPLPATAPKKERPWLISASRLSPEKGLDVLLEAFARLRRHLDADLVLLGEGPDRPRVERLASEMGVAANLILPGFQPNPFPWIARSEVYAQASRLEGFGNALVEAMALGVPVVSTACRWGPIEILAEPGSGLLVPVDDPAALGVALERVLREKTLRSGLSEGGQRRAEAFSFATMLDGYECVIRGCARTTPSPKPPRTRSDERAG
jgi:glycosyltransferase involved in cell wall biosynthesis